MFSQEQDELLNAPLAKAFVATLSVPGKPKMSYLPSHHIIREANRIFGFGGWSSKTHNINMVQAELKDDKWYIGYTAFVTVSFGADKASYDGVGFGQGQDKDLGKSHESAIKEAESDALKRAMRNLGDQFGLALYDKAQTYVDDGKAPAPAPKKAPVPVEPVPAGVSAFGYVPKNWPTIEAWSKPATDAQIDRISALLHKRGWVSVQDQSKAATAILEAYKVVKANHQSSGAMVLIIAWLMDAPDEAFALLNEATEAVAA